MKRIEITGRYDGTATIELTKDGLILIDIKTAGHMGWLHTQFVGVQPDGQSEPYQLRIYDALNHREADDEKK